MHFHFSFYSYIRKIGVNGVTICFQALILLDFYGYTIGYTFYKIGVTGVTKTAALPSARIPRTCHQTP